MVFCYTVDMTEVEKLTKALERVHKQREKYERAYYEKSEQYRKLEDKHSIILNHNFIHMSDKAKLQDKILELEIMLFERHIDKKNNLLIW